MTSLLSLGVSAFVIGLSGALAPGPLTAMTVAESARRGFRAGPLLTLGHAIAEALIIIALALGLSHVFQNGLVSRGIAVVGGVVLVWMGWGIVRSVRRGEIKLRGQEQSARHVSALEDVRAGVLVSVSNPYWVLWWATVGATYVVIALGYGVAGLVALFIGHILSDLSWNSLLAAAASSGRRIVSDRAYGIVLATCGLVLVAMGLTFVGAGAGVLAGLMQ